MNDARPPPRRRWFRNRGIDLADLAVNSFAAFLGVLLALMVQSWTSSRDKTEHLMQARQALEAEIKANKVVIEQLIVDYEHFEQMAKSDRSSATTLHNGCDHIEGWHGFQIPIVLRSAYETTLATGLLGQMPFDESQRIASTYATQSTYLGFLEKNLDWYVEMRIKESDPCAKVFDNSLGVLRKLVERYDGYLGTAKSP